MAGGASARASSPAEANRSAGTRASAFRTARSTASGTAGRYCRTLGASLESRRAAIACAVGPGERRLARQHLVQHGAERVDVGPRVELPLARRLLRAHVGRRADRHARSRSGARRPPSARAMPKSATSAWPSLSRMFSGLMSRWIDPVPVGVVERVGRLARDPDRVLHRELLLPTSRSRRLSPSMNGMVNQSRPAGLARVEDGEDVRMLQAGGQLDLAQEPLGAERRGRAAGAAP